MHPDRDPKKELDLGLDIAIPDPASIRPIEPAAPEQEGPSLVERIRAVWTVVEKVVEEAVQVAEGLYGAGSGAAKKEFVVEKVMKLLDHLEDQVDILPGIVQGLVFRAIRLFLPILVERVFRGLGSKLLEAA